MAYIATFYPRIIATVVDPGLSVERRLRTCQPTVTVEYRVHQENGLSSRRLQELRELWEHLSLWGDLSGRAPGVVWGALRELPVCKHYTSRGIGECPPLQSYLCN